MAVAWQKNPSTRCFAKNMVRPPTAAGMGISRQNDVVPNTLLHFKQFSHELFFDVSVKCDTVFKKKKKLTKGSKSLEKLHKPLNHQLVRNLQIYREHRKIFLLSDFYSLPTLVTAKWNIHFKQSETCFGCENLSSEHSQNIME